MSTKTADKNFYTDEETFLRFIGFNKYNSRGERFELAKKIFNREPIEYCMYDDREDVRFGHFAFPAIAAWGAPNGINSLVGRYFTALKPDGMSMIDGKIPRDRPIVVVNKIVQIDQYNYIHPPTGGCWSMTNCFILKRDS